MIVKDASFDIIESKWFDRIQENDLRDTEIIKEIEPHQIEQFSLKARTPSNSFDCYESLKSLINGPKPDFNTEPEVNEELDEF